mmetsp:Transcript_35104/g.98568  ORF Transcript_35104/g.98568 Transcript_35104/m.98568 type:complete len:345 (-) Transcript_35104:412-1446(-)
MYVFGPAACDSMRRRAVRWLSILGLHGRPSDQLHRPGASGLHRQRAVRLDPGLHRPRHGHLPRRPRGDLGGRGGCPEGVHLSGREPGGGAGQRRSGWCALGPARRPGRHVPRPRPHRSRGLAARRQRRLRLARGRRLAREGLLPRSDPVLVGPRRLGGLLLRRGWRRRRAERPLEPGRGGRRQVGADTGRRRAAGRRRQAGSGPRRGSAGAVHRLAARRGPLLLGCAGRQHGGRVLDPRGHARGLQPRDGPRGRGVLGGAARGPGLRLRGGQHHGRGDPGATDGLPGGREGVRGRLVPLARPGGRVPVPDVPSGGEGFRDIADDRDRHRLQLADSEQRSARRVQ